MIFCKRGTCVKSFQWREFFEMLSRLIVMPQDQLMSSIISSLIPSEVLPSWAINALFRHLTRSQQWRNSVVWVCRLSGLSIACPPAEGFIPPPLCDKCGGYLSSLWACAVPLWRCLTFHFSRKRRVFKVVLIAWGDARFSLLHRQEEKTIRHLNQQ